MPLAARARGMAATGTVAGAWLLSVAAALAPLAVTAQTPLATLKKH